MRTTTLGEIAPNVTSGSRGWASFYSAEGALFLRMTNLPKTGIGLLLHDNKYVKLPGGSSEGVRTRVQTNDILISITAELGKIGFVETNLGEAYINQHVALVRVEDSSTNPKYLAHYMASQTQRNRLNRLNDSGAKAGLSLQTINRFPLELPPLPEQKAIADLLSTWDEAIEKTERLIQGKEKRFKGLLHELISEPQMDTNKYERKKVKLSDVCTVITSNVDKKTVVNEIPVRLCNYMDVYRNYYITSELGFMEASATSAEIKKFHLKPNDVLLTKDSETPDDIANSACVIEELENVLCGYHLTILRPQKQLFGPYLNFALHTPRIRYEFSRQANGATRFGLTMSAYNMVDLSLPHLEEQQQIAGTLSAAQQEINLFKQLADKYKTQKRGLMQKMLTGVWRVKPEIVNKYNEV